MSMVTSYPLHSGLYVQCTPMCKTAVVFSYYKIGRLMEDSAMRCIGGGDDISKIPSKRRSLYSDSVGDSGPQKQAPLWMVETMIEMIEEGRHA